VAPDEKLTNRERTETYIRGAGLPTIWCPGCGIGTVVWAMTWAVDHLGIPRDDVVVATGIGCSGYLYNYLNFDGYHGTHGRALPAATGIKMANPRLQVLAPMGDGDCAAIGGNHFIHAARRNVDLTAIVINNGIYGMTGGQYSPLTARGSRASTAPFGAIEDPFDISALAMAAGATFVARGGTYQPRQLAELIARGMAHKGFSVIEAISQCPVQYGSRNPPGLAADMIRWQRDHAVPLERAVAMSQADLKGCFTTGVLRDEDCPENEYSARWAGVVAEAQGAQAAMQESGMPAATVLAGRTPLGRPLGGRSEVRLAGVGGQGLALAGEILATAAGMVEGRRVAQVEFHGANQRGGPSRAEVVISNDEIAYPAVSRTDVLLAMTTKAVADYLPKARPGSVVIVDSTHVAEIPASEAVVYAIPLTRIARDLGAEISVNIVALAAVVALSGVVTPEALESAALSRLPARSHDLNRRALLAGWAAAEAAFSAAGADGGAWSPESWER
jgi:2-oxoglutarate ferredoxin oxidoreductase subunit beta